jgi:hypothetical protein
MRLRTGDRPGHRPRHGGFLFCPDRARAHGTEAVFIAAAHSRPGAPGSPEAAILNSVGAMATRGASGLTLQSHSQMIRALEAVNRMLLFGSRAAFIFTVMQFYYHDLVLPALPGGSAERERDLMPKVPVLIQVLFLAKIVRPLFLLFSEFVRTGRSRGACSPGRMIRLSIP